MVIFLTRRTMGGRFNNIYGGGITPCRTQGPNGKKGLFQPLFMVVGGNAARGN